MSTQSGITSSSELIDAFKKYIDTSSRALIIKIEDEKLLPEDIVAGSSSLEQDLDQIREKLSENKACYLVVKNDQSDQKHIFVSFVPDYAHVKAKMLYASTKNTILRELGLEFFDPVVFVNELDEISGDGIRQILIHESSSGPLTESEQSLAQAKQQEQLSLLSSDSRRRELAQQTDTDLSLKVTPELHSKVKSLSKGEYATAKLVSDDSIDLHSSAKVVSPSELIEKIPSAHPSYTIYKYDDSKLAFVLTVPSGSRVRERMLYASSKSAFMKKLAIEFAKTIEAGDATEIDIAEFEENEPQPVASASLRFSKPRGPKRK